MGSMGRGVLDTRRSLSSGARSRDPVAGMTGEYPKAPTSSAKADDCYSVIASTCEAIQPAARKDWIASSLTLLAMTRRGLARPLTSR